MTALKERENCLCTQNGKIYDNAEVSLNKRASKEMSTREKADSFLPPNFC